MAAVADATRRLQGLGGGPCPSGDGSGPGADPEPGPAARRRGRRSWQFTPPLEVVVDGEWRLRSSLARRDVEGRVVGRLELAQGSGPPAWQDEVLVGSSHGRTGFVRGALGGLGDGDGPPPSADRLARAVLDLGAAVEARVNEVEGVEHDARQSSRRAKRRSSALPEIAVNGRPMREITQDAVAALQRGNEVESRFFRFGTGLVRLRRTPAVVTELLTRSALRGELDRLADFAVVPPSSALARAPEVELEPRPVPPPYFVVDDLLALPEPDLPRLTRVATVPTFVAAAGGVRLLAEPGYDMNSGILLDLSQLGQVPELPPQVALDLLTKELLGDFPFADDASRCHAMAALFQPFVRDLVEGPTPLLAIDAPTARTGKTLLASCVSALVTGTTAHPMFLPRDDDELDKRIIASLLAGHAVVLIDNVARMLDSPSLSAALTADVYRGRLLGRSTILELPNRALWLVTGNNLDLSGEIQGRSLSCRLDASMEHPGRRGNFRHRHLLSWVKDNRARLVGAVLALVRAWVTAGMPAPTAPNALLGGFEGYVCVVGGILEYLEIPGFLCDRERLAAARGSGGGEWEALCHRLRETFGDHAFTAREALVEARGRDGAEPLLVNIWNGWGALSASQRLGHALHRHRDRRYGPFVIRQVEPDSHSGAQRFQLEAPGLYETLQTRHWSSEWPNSSAGFAGFAGFPSDPADVPVEFES